MPSWTSDHVRQEIERINFVHYRYISNRVHLSTTEISRKPSIISHIRHKEVIRFVEKTAFVRNKRQGLISRGCTFYSWSEARHIDKSSLAFELWFAFVETRHPEDDTVCFFVLIIHFCSAISIVVAAGPWMTNGRLLHGEWQNPKLSMDSRPQSFIMTCHETEGKIYPSIPMYKDAQERFFRCVRVVCRNVTRRNKNSQIPIGEVDDLKVAMKRIRASYCRLPPFSKLWNPW